jgi:hypothetical protein
VVLPVWAIAEQCSCFVRLLTRNIFILAIRVASADLSIIIT